MDNARRKTDKLLNGLERRIDDVYKNDSSLLSMVKKYADYMEMVKTLTESSYEAYINETDPNTKEKLKKVYMDQVRSFTLKSVSYNRIVDEFTRVISEVNQKALDLVNDSMGEIYAINYNAVADECKKVGIKVNG